MNPGLFAEGEITKLLSKYAGHYLRHQQSTSGNNLSVTGAMTASACPTPIKDFLMRVLHNCLQVGLLHTIWIARSFALTKGIRKNYIGLQQCFCGNPKYVL